MRRTARSCGVRKFLSCPASRKKILEEQVSVSEYHSGIVRAYCGLSCVSSVICQFQSWLAFSERLQGIRDRILRVSSLFRLKRNHSFLSFAFPYGAIYEPFYRGDASQDFAANEATSYTAPARNLLRCLASPITAPDPANWHSASCYLQYKSTRIQKK